MAGTLEVALRWCSSHEERVLSFANSRPAPAAARTKWPVPKLLAQAISERLGRPVNLSEIGMGEAETTDASVGLDFPRDPADAVPSPLRSGAPLTAATSWPDPASPPLPSPPPSPDGSSPPPTRPPTTPAASRSDGPTSTNCMRPPTTPAAGTPNTAAGTGRPTPSPSASTTGPVPCCKAASPTRSAVNSSR